MDDEHETLGPYDVIAPGALKPYDAARDTDQPKPQVKDHLGRVIGHIESYEEHDGRIQVNMSIEDRAYAASIPLSGAFSIGPAAGRVEARMVPPPAAYRWPGDSGPRRHGVEISDDTVRRMHEAASEVVVPVEDVALPEDCGDCWTCIRARVSVSPFPLSMPFVVCVTCGNKRCPKATHHANECTGSNEPGQAGSRFEGSE